MWGVPVPPESPSMNPETGRFSATNVSKVINVAENQNGRGDVIPNPMKPKDEGRYHLITFDEDDNVQTHLISSTT